MELGLLLISEPLSSMFAILTICSTRSSPDQLPTQEQLDQLIDVVGERPQWYRHANMVSVWSHERGLVRYVAF